MQSITIISGGQTGADRAALDFALEHDLAHGGWCPRGRLAEDGLIPAEYELKETPSRRYAQRTEWNVRDSDATVLLTMGRQLQGGTALTRDWAERLGKPWLHLIADEAASMSENEEAPGRPAVESAAAKLSAFLARHQVSRLNIAGPRASQEPKIAGFVGNVLKKVWSGHL